MLVSKASKIWASISAAFVILFAASIGGLIEDVRNGQYVVIQYPFTGKVAVYTQPGVVWQLFGTITTYPKRAQYSFNKGCRSEDPYSFPAEPIRFADGGSGTLCGAISWEMPPTPAQILRLHSEFWSMEAIERQLLGKALQSAIYLSGQTMSSTESAGPRRSELFHHINDQTLHGIYQSTTRTVEREDPVTKLKSSMNITEIQRDGSGKPVRLQGSAISSYGISLLPLNISEIAYSKAVESQITARQDAIAQIEISAAKARRAEQETTQAEQEGRRSATRERWEQEKLNYKENALAEQKLKSQLLATQTAEAYKREQILRGEGDAAYKRMVMEADGALDPKLKAYIEVNAKYAEAIQKYGGAWVPTINMAGNSSSGQNTGLALIELLTAKAAKDLSLDPTISGRSATSGSKK